MQLQKPTQTYQPYVTQQNPIQLQGNFKILQQNQQNIKLQQQPQQWAQNQFQFSQLQPQSIQQNVVFQNHQQYQQQQQSQQQRVVQSIQAPIKIPQQQVYQQQQVIAQPIVSGTVFQQQGQICHSFLLKKNVDKRKKYQTPGLYGDFSEGTEKTRAQIEEMKKTCQELLEGKISKTQNMQDAEYSYLTTYNLYNYKLSKQFQYHFSKKEEEFQLFEYSDKRKKGSNNAALGADNYAKQLAAIPDNKFDFSKEGSTRKIKIDYYDQYEASIVITYDDEGVIKTSKNHKDLVGLDILHYLSCLMHADLSFVMKNKDGKVFYDFESELYQRVPKKIKFVGKDFMEFHDNAKTFGYVLKDLMPLLMRCWAQRLIDVVILDLRNFEIYQHKMHKDLLIKRTQRDHYYGAFDDEGNFIGIALYTYVYLQKLEQKELPYKGGEFFEFNNPDEFLCSFDMLPFDHEIYKKVAQQKY